MQSHEASESSRSFPPKDSGLTEAIKKDVARITFIHWNEPPKPEKLISVPLSISSEPITFKALKKVIFGRLIPASPEEKPKQQENQLLTQPKMTEQEIVPRNEQHEIYTRRSSHIGNLDRRMLAALIRQEAIKAKEEGRQPENKISAKDTYKIFRKRPVPVSQEETHPEQVIKDSQTESPTPIEPAEPLFELVERPLPSWISKDTQVNIIMLRGTKAGGDVETETIKKQNRANRTFGLWTQLKFANDAQTTIFPVTIDGSQIGNDVQTDKFLNLERKRTSETFENIYSVLESFKSPFRGDVVIPMLSILDTPHSPDENKFLDNIAQFILFTKNHYGYSIILESRTREESAEELIKTNFGYIGEYYMKDTLVLNYKDETAQRDIVRLTDYILDHIQDPRVL